MIHHGDPSFPLRFLDEKTSMQHRTGPDSGTSMRNRVLQTLNAISGSMLQLSLSLSPSLSSTSESEFVDIQAVIILESGFIVCLQQ